MNISNVFIVVFAILWMITFDEKHQELPEDSQARKDAVYYFNNLSIAVVFSLMFNIVEFVNQIRIFDYFQGFVRQLLATIEDSIQIAIMLIVMVVFWAMAFFTLEASQNFDVREGGYTPTMALIDSYRMALGDFEVFGRFEESEDAWVFYIIFGIGTVLQLLIILNMVIAVMGASFEAVNDDLDAHMIKEKLTYIVDNWFRLPEATKEEMRKSRYLVLLNIDPQGSFEESGLDDEEDAKIEELVSGMRVLLYEQARSNTNID